MITRSRLGIVACALLLVAAPPFACSSSDKGGTSTACAQAVQLLRGCDLLTAGVYRCEEPSTDVERCVARCVLQANCAQLEEFYCNVSPSSPIMLCSDSCFTFRCRGDGSALPEWARCDGAPDCADGSDEQGCDYFTCSDGTVLDKSWRCDGYPDCFDGEDEYGCPTFTCQDGEVIGASGRCNGYFECYDGSDEENCPGYVRCSNGTGSVSPEAKCDGYPDCSDGSDELGCPERATLKCE